ncbi:cytochrome c biogenesis CcdA family protein [Specibacter cremeus]|uniref:cytochrome c biogenesis CcdA family protein n=1 Tax=Specibacter cremeus TaxID=1629051 RepID=UPI000F78C1D8|nr:cytochrome c biogenesis protein CcdA [Specibacter cremeus]
MSLGEFFATTVTSGALLITMPLALIAGIVSFLSPCILPLVPGYLGYVSGLTDPNQPRNHRRVLAGVGLFVLGFGAVFTLYGAAFGIMGPTLSAVLALSVTSGSAWRGALPAFIYCLGLGIPFLLVALGLGWVSQILGFIRRHIRVVNLAGAGMLILLGVLMVSGVWMQWIYQRQNLSGSFLTIV